MILCCGEALIDMIPVTQPGGGAAFVPHTGGAVFNTAIGLGRLGARVSLLSGVSTDMFGARLLQDLQAAGVDTAPLIRSDRPTTLAFVTLDGGAARYAFYDENTAGRMLTAADLPRLDANIHALFFGGISLCVAPAAQMYEAAAQQAGDRVVMLDPNIRPGFVQDEDAYRQRLARMMGLAQIVKLSVEDLDWLIPDPAPQIDRLHRIRDLGVGLVILTRGADGACALAGDEAIALPAPQVPVVDTVGAGDAFNAGLLARLSDLGLLTRPALQTLEAAALRDALSFAIRVAALSVTRAGASPPDLDEMRAFAAK